MDIIESVVQSPSVEAIDEELTVGTLKDCDIVFQRDVSGDRLHLQGKIPHILNRMVSCLSLRSQGQYVRFYWRLLKNHFIYIGAHPMAGREFSGFSHSMGSLFENASMILVPFHGTRIETVQSVKELCRQIGFGYIQISTPEEHDRMIAFTSQLAHVVSSSYIKSPTALEHIGFSRKLTFREVK